MSSLSPEALSTHNIPEMWLWQLATRHRVSQALLKGLAESDRFVPSLEEEAEAEE